MKESIKKGIGLFFTFFFWMSVFITGFFGLTSFPKNIYIGMEVFALIVSMIIGIAEGDLSEK